MDLLNMTNIAQIHEFYIKNGNDNKCILARVSVSKIMFATLKVNTSCSHTATSNTATGFS